jgi:cellulase/cellobiase CelA1
VATYKIAGQWQGGFQGEVTVKNTGSSMLRGWTVTWTFANGQKITQLWNGTYTQSGAVVTVKNLSWNGGIGPNVSQAFGFLGSWTGTNTAPTPTCTAL